MSSRASEILRWGSLDVGDGFSGNEGLLLRQFAAREAGHALEMESVQAHLAQSTAMVDGDDVLGRGHVPVGGRHWSV